MKTCSKLLIGGVLVILSALNIFAAETFLITTKYKDGRTVSTKQTIENNADGSITFRFPKEKISADIDIIEVLPDFAKAKVGDEGYVVLPTSIIIPYTAQKDFSHTPWSTNKNEWHLPISGMKIADTAYYSRVDGLKFEHNITVSISKGVYTLKTFFRIGQMGFKPYEDIVINYFFLKGDNANYSGIARDYRKYLLENKICKSIKDRLTPELDYASKSIELRIRQAWKPVPTPVEEQTPENEPPVKVKMTFDKVADFIREMKAAGIENAQICLVGWNHKGHDGRWPTAFPVEPSLGGEKKLMELVAYAKMQGYAIVCHTNSTDIYSVSSDWKNGAPVAKKPDGSIQKNAACWGGGRMYNLCPIAAFEFAKRDFPRIKQIGFRGLHYIDVISIIPPHECSDPNHPCNRKESTACLNEIMQYAKDNFGGVASEGPAYHVAQTLDYALYTHFGLLSKKSLVMGGKVVPFWQIIFNGIILNNPFTESTNYTIKDKAVGLKFIEFGGRPAFYLYSAFLTNKQNWMGNSDLTCESPEDIARSIAAIKKGVDEFNKLSHLQKEFIHSHEEIAPNVTSTNYENGTKIICNHTMQDYTYNSQTIKPQSYIVIAPTFWEKIRNAIF